MTDLDQLQRALGDSYTIQRELGGGGMSRVFVARENALDRSVVIKVLPRDLGGDVSVDRFRREIQLVASALAVYQRYVATPALFRIFQDAVWLPGIYYRLGELYEAKGDRTKAAEYYGRFAELWKHADPSLQSRVTETKRRVVGLTAEPRQ